MSSKKQIFLLYACDRWKGISSTSLLCVSTSSMKIKQKIAKEIKNGYMCYEDEELSNDEQAKLFKEDWKRLTPQRIDDKLIYGYYYYVHDGEEL